MAHFSKQNAKQLREALKDAFPLMRFSVRIRHHSSVNVTVTSGNMNLAKVYRDGRNYESVNCYRINDHYERWPDVRDFLLRVREIIKFGTDNPYYDNSDPMTDYFDTAFYYDISIGTYEKEYIYNKNIKEAKCDYYSLSDVYKKASCDAFDRRMKNEERTDGEFDPWFNRDDDPETEIGAETEAETSEILEEHAESVDTQYNPEPPKPEVITKTVEVKVEVEKRLTNDQILITMSNSDGALDILEVIRDATNYLDGTSVCEIKIGEKIYNV